MNVFKEKTKGLRFIVSAPSGTGKTTVIRELVKEHPNVMARVITCTTRKPRGEEINGVDYRFLSDEEFDQKVANNEFLEHQQIFSHKYGTLKSDVDEQIESGRHAFLVIDVQGAAELIDKIDATKIFMMPPSFEELEQRIRLRKQDDEKAIELRLSKAKGEMEQVKKYDYVVTNEKVDEAVNIIRSIVVATEHKLIGGKI